MARLESSKLKVTVHWSINSYRLHTRISPGAVFSLSFSLETGENLETFIALFYLFLLLGTVQRSTPFSYFHTFSGFFLYIAFFYSFLNWFKRKAHCGVGAAFPTLLQRRCLDVQLNIFISSENINCTKLCWENNSLHFLLL